VKTTTVRDHIMTTNTYDDETLQLVGTTVMAEPGWQLNGHRADCRCLACRPDIVRLGARR
jgi:hypothetical protein